MDGFGVDIQFLSNSTPGTYFAGEGLSLTLAQMTNGFIADICRKFPNCLCIFCQSSPSKYQRCDGRVGQGSQQTLGGRNFSGRLHQWTVSRFRRFPSFLQ